MADRRHLPTGFYGQQFDCKSLRTVVGRTADFGELAMADGRLQIADGNTEWT